MALYEDEDYGNKHKGLFSRGGECLVKGICFMGTPFYGSGRANTLVPFVRALEEVNFISAVNATILRSLKENEKESVELRNIVQRFKTIAEKRSIRLLIGCEQKTFAGSSLVRNDLYGVLLVFLRWASTKLGMLIKVWSLGRRSPVSNSHLWWHCYRIWDWRWSSWNYQIWLSSYGL